MDHSEINRLKTELAEAVGLLWFIQGYLEEGQDSHVKSKIRSFISRHRLDEYAQAEQQEAQGAQAGDFWKYADKFKGRGAFTWKELEDAFKSGAALATQPEDRKS